MSILEQLIQALNENQLWQKSISLQRNDFLVFKNEINTQLYFVESGSLKIYFENQHEEQIIRLGYTGNLIATLDSFISEQPTDFYIQAIKKTTVKSIPKSVFTDFINQAPPLLLLWQRILELMIYQQLEREKDILIQSPKERYERVLKRSPRLFQEIPNKYIASYLRMSPETLSRLKSKS
jgi:CRP-like cAMP-binding protein